MKAPYKKFFFAGLVTFAFIAACSSNSTPKVDDGDTDDGIIGGSTGSGGKTDGTGSTGSGGKTGSGGSDGSGGGIVVPPTGREDCEDTPNGDECWDLTKCNGTSEIQFLKQCNDGDCFPFNNSERIPGYTGDDSLPALP